MRKTPHQRVAVSCCLTAGLLLASSAIGFAQPGTADRNPERVVHLLNRIAYGPSKEDLNLVEKVGIESYIKAQLSPASLSLPAKVEQVAQVPALQETPVQLFLNYGRPAIKAAAGLGGKGANDIEKKKELNKVVQGIYKKMYEEAAMARFTRAAESPRQLQEVMTDFWFNHFNVSIEKGLDHVWVGNYEETAIRPNALGRFRDLLGATSRHAAMLFYLDNWQNTVANAAGLGKRFKGINENYARELMELHTLGVDGGYTQKDVQELARVLTGLGLPPGGGAGFGLRNPQQRRAMLAQGQLGNGGFAGFGAQARKRRGLGAFGDTPGSAGGSAAPFGSAGRSTAPSFAGKGVRNYGPGVDLASIPGDQKFGSYFDERRHDFGEKVLLGQPINGKGAAEVDEVLDLLSRHPSTARHISYKLAQYFVADEPPQTLVNKLAKRFTETDGQIAAVLDTLFHSPEFWDPKYTSAKFKSPYRYVVSSLRATDAQLVNPTPLLAFLKQTGMPLYKCLTPDGYKNTQTAWLNPDNLINRLNFATALGAGKYPGVRLTATSGGNAAEVVGNLSDKTLKTIEGAPQQLRLALLLGSPEFMKY